jgi:RNA polymerase sigma factor (sigma-70 family)
MPRLPEREDPPDPDMGALDMMMEEERTAGLTAAMEKLEGRCRELLLLYYYEERSMEEIASTLGFANADTAKSKKYQCKKALERLLKAADNE